MRFAALASASALLALVAACALPSQGTPVFVEAHTGRWWSGEAVLTEVSPDQKRCLIHARTNAGFVESKWLDCAYVHNRKPQRN